MLSRSTILDKADGVSDSPVTVVPDLQALSKVPLFVITDIEVLPPSEDDSLLKHVIYGQRTEPDGRAALSLLAAPKAK